jgi:hypothetical protein
MTFSVVPSFFGVESGEQVGRLVGLLDECNSTLLSQLKAQYGIAPEFKNEKFYLLNNSVRADYCRSEFEGDIHVAFASAINGRIYKVFGFFSFAGPSETFATVIQYVKGMDQFVLKAKESSMTPSGGSINFWEFGNGNIVLETNMGIGAVYVTSDWIANVRLEKLSFFSKIFN